LHIGFSVTYNAIIPLFHGPDEQSHYVYVQHLVKYHSLPRITRPDDPTGTRDERDGAIAIHPPLYYVTALPVYLLASPLGDEWRQRALRLLATAFAIGTLLLILRIAWLIFPTDLDTSHGVFEELEGDEHRPALSLIPPQFANSMQAHAWMQIAVIGFAALLPHFLLLSSVINNDGPFILLNTWLLLLIVRSQVSHSATQPPSQLAAAGAVFGLCLLTKASAVSIIPLMMVVALMHAKDETEYSLPRWFANVALIFFPALLIAGWWYAWYFHVHHRLYFIPKDVRFGPPLRYDSIMDWLADDNRWFAVKRFLVGISQSIWSQVDWILPNDPNHPEQATSAAYPLSNTLWVLFTCSLLVATLGNMWNAWSLRRARLMGLLFSTWVHFGLYAAALFYSTLFIHPGGFQGGRYLLPGIGGLSLFFCVGIIWSVQIRVKHRINLLPRVAAAMCIAMLALLALWNVACIINNLQFLNPVYSPGA